MPCRLDGARCVSVLMGLGTFDLLTLKLVCESHQRWGTFLPNFGTLDLWVVELFVMYATDGWTDRQTDKINATDQAYSAACGTRVGRWKVETAIAGINSAPADAVSQVSDGECANHATREVHGRRQ